MCLRFGSDPRRDFLSTETPQRTRTTGDEPALKLAASQQPEKSMFSRWRGWLDSDRGSCEQVAK